MSMMRHKKQQAGFSLVSALFLLVVLGALGAYMVSISGTQQFTTVQALQGARAYHAARSGVDWGIAAATAAGACPAATTLNGGDLNGFQVNVSCTSSNHQEGAVTYRVYEITASAQTISPAFGQPGYAARRLSATVTDAP